MMAMALLARNGQTCGCGIWLVIQNSYLSVQIHTFSSQLDHNFLIP